MASFSAPERWRQLESLFYRALELKAEERTAFVENCCVDDPELKSELQALLHSVDNTVDLVDQSIHVAARQVTLASDRPAVLPGTHLSHYELGPMLGRGGMGQVYLANDTRLKRKVAVKLLAPQLIRDQIALRRFEHEALAASALNHPNIITIYEFGKVDDLHFIVSEFVEGTTLRTKVMQGQIEVNHALDIVIQIGRALSAAHSHGIIHRDVKPDNVIIRHDGIVKVLDFGIAKLVANPSAAAKPKAATATLSTTQPGIVMGTAKYMSPEQARGIDVDPRSDIFSLGVVLYEMLAGKAAFDGETSSDVVAAILRAEPIPLVQFVPSLPVRLEHIVNQALCKDRSSRYQTMDEFVRELRELKTDLEFQAKLQYSHGRSEAAQPVSAAASQPASIRTARSADHSSSSDQILRFAPHSALRFPAKMAVPVIAGILVLILGLLMFRKANPGAGLTSPRSLAILPFRNLKQDPGTDFLGFSLADAIITKLGYISDFVVRPSTSVDRYRNQVIDPRKVGADLNVSTLLTGTFIKEGDDLRINTQLIDVRQDKILWRDSINLKYDKLLSVQDRVSQEIIKGLQLKLSPAEAENLKPEKPINGLAYEYYLRGVDLYSLNEFSAAIKMLEQSSAIEPNYAPTWAYLGRAYTTNASLQFGGHDLYRKAQLAYEKAIALNPALTEPRIYMANLLTDTGRVEQAVPLLRAVLQMNPNNAEAHWELGYAYRFGGMLQESVAECEQARQFNPQVKINSSALNGYLYLGQFDKFMQSLPVNDSAYILFYRGLSEYYLRNYEQASNDFDRAYQADPDLLQAKVGKALGFSIAHQPAQGLELLQRTAAEIDERGVMDAEGIYKLAQAFAVLGDQASALRMFRRSIDGGFFCYPYFVTDPLLSNIRKQAEFGTLLSQAQQRHEQFKARFFSPIENLTSDSQKNPT
jgi:serine/threonine protein kinase/tetratricopeptide (TPR) repeat protein